MRSLVQWKSNKYYIFWEGVCSLRYPASNVHAPRCHLWPAWLYNIFSHYLKKARLKKFLNVKCVFLDKLKLLSATFLILRRMQRDMIKNVHWSSFEVPLIFVRIKWNFIFLDRFLKNIRTSNFTKILQVGAEFFHAGRRADGQKQIWRSK